MRRKWFRTRVGVTCSSFSEFGNAVSQPLGRVSRKLRRLARAIREQLVAYTEVIHFTRAALNVCPPFFTRPSDDEPGAVFWPPPTSDLAGRESQPDAR